MNFTFGNRWWQWKLYCTSKWIVTILCSLTIKCHCRQEESTRQLLTTSKTTSWENGVTSKLSSTGIFKRSQLLTAADNGPMISENIKLKVIAMLMTGAMTHVKPTESPSPLLNYQVSVVQKRSSHLTYCWAPQLYSQATALWHWIQGDMWMRLQS